MRSLPAEIISNMFVQDGMKTKIDHGQRCRRFMPIQVHSPLNVGPKSSEHWKRSLTWSNESSAEGAQEN